MSVNVYMDSCIYICIFMCICTCMFICMCACAHVCICACMCMHADVSIYLFLCMLSQLCLLLFEYAVMSDLYYNSRKSPASAPALNSIYKSAVAGQLPFPASGGLAFQSESRPKARCPQGLYRLMIQIVHSMHAAGSVHSGTRCALLRLRSFILAAKRICHLLSGTAVYAETLTIRLRQILSASNVARTVQRPCISMPNRIISRSRILSASLSSSIRSRSSCSIGTSSEIRPSALVLRK